MNSTETAQILTVLSGAYPNQEVTDETAMLWANAFAGDSMSDVKVAVIDWINNEQWWPTPAGIRERIRNAKRQQQYEQPRPALPSGVEWMPYPEGVRVAYDAYCRQVRKDGKTPREFDSFRKSLGVVPQ